MGRSLRSLVGNKEVSLERRVGWLCDIAKALSAAHRAGVVHRDIKPENVMVREDSVVKVLDFGVARHAAVDLDAPGISPAAETLEATGTSGRLAGTPAYMAPEQVRGKAVDGRTDQFAWGIVAYELLTGKLPWSKIGSVVDVITCVVNEQPPPLRELVPEIPEAIEAVVMRALSKPREARFPTMGELLDALAPGEPRSSSLGPASRASTNLVYAGATDVTITIPEVTKALADSPDSPSAPTEPPGTLGGSRPSGAPPPSRTAPVAPPGRARPPWAWLLGAVLATVGVTGAVLKVSPRPQAPLVAPSAVPSVVTAVAPPVTTSLAALPPPKGCTPEATTAYMRGMGDMRDGNWDQANASFERAAIADPSCAAAHFRHAFTAYTRAPVSRVREIYKTALDLRGSLGERDQLLLDALDPRIRSEPPDESAYRTRLRALAERYPGDAELACLAGEQLEDLDDRVREMRRVLAMDPGYSDAFQFLGRTQARQGDITGALATLDQCVRVVQNSVDCVRARNVLLDEAGRCGELAESSRIWIARDPRTHDGYLWLARALAAQDNAAAAEDALEQRWASMSEADRQIPQLFEHAFLDALTGNFGAALRRARTLDALVDKDPNLAPHVRARIILVEILLEQNQREQAGRLAGELVARRSAWSTNVWPSDANVVINLFEPRLDEAARFGGAIAEAPLAAARAEWGAAMRRSTLFDAAHIWAADVAAPVSTPAEAVEALRTMPASLRPGAGGYRAPSHHTDAFTGHALLLAGEIDAAIPFLRSTATSCGALSNPFVHTRASLWLGQALEQKSDVPGACAAYGVVLRRWGQTRPPSLTAEAARKRADALHCPR